MSPRRSLFGLVLAGAVLTGGCSGSRAAIERRLQTSARESQPDVLQERAAGFASIGDFSRAAQYLEAALARGGSEESILPLLVDVQVRGGRFRAAAAIMKEYLRSHPRHTRARFVLASLLVALGENAAAIPELERVLSLDPIHGEAAFALAVLYRDFVGDPQIADGYFRRYLSLDPTGPHQEEARASLLTEL